MGNCQLPHRKYLYNKESWRNNSSFQIQQSKSFSSILC
ncbi:Bgt-51683 [Blumeria graminis f. sp. tritici]|uniref:Bgt-51683 n=1 Tax=Blumeria graminis f. sp. tritici TaxID=62690 RepID=A0A9X9MEK8_BLUGR|nr:Bgt-51683 [Blumeria graminis f. sp. tritici]